MNKQWNNRPKTQPAKEPLSPEDAYAQPIAGRNAVRELLSSGRDIDKIYVAKGDRDGSILALIGQARERGIPLLPADRTRLEQLCGHSGHQGIVAMAAQRNYCTVEELLQHAAEKGEFPLLVLADGIEDPHNLGAIIRCAECAGAHGLIIPKRRAVGLTAVVAKSSAGAIEHLPIARVTNLVTTVEDLKKKGLWVYAADMGGQAYYETDMTSPAVIVLGSEGFGISQLLRKSCDFTVSIPLYGQVNSMNVSTAAAVILSEAARQRHARS